MILLSMNFLLLLYLVCKNNTFFTKPQKRPKTSPPDPANPKKNLNISKKACRKVLFAIFAAKYERKTQSTNYKSNF